MGVQADWSADARGGIHGALRAFAAVLGQESDEAVDGLKRRPIDQVPARSLLRNKAGAREFFEMERKRRIRRAERLAHCARSQPRLTRNDKGAEDPQAHRVGQRSKGNNDFFFIHALDITNFPEIWKYY